MDYLEKVLDEFGKVSQKPETFLSVDNSNSKQIKSLLKKNYDFTKTEESDQIKSQALPELIVKDFDLEQIWQQMELQNDGFLTRSLRNVSKLVVTKDKLIFSELKSHIQNEATEEEEVQKASDESSDDEDDDERPLQLDEDDDLSLNSDDLEGEQYKNIDEKKTKSKSSVVDDKFFKLDEMEAFLNSEEKKMNDKEPDSGNDTESDEDEEMEDDDDVDLFKDDSDDMESNEKERGHKKNPKYKDFFELDNNDKPKSKVQRNKFLEQHEKREEEEEGEEEDEDDVQKDIKEGNESNIVKSSLELREERLRRKIGYIEEAAISDKPWQLKGEITADSRPQNSLLEEIVEFDLTTRPAPIITEQTSMILEDVIRQRIKDKVFDSVVRKEKPIESLLEYKKKLVLNQEKSKESLAQIYEKEYLQQKEALDPEAAEKEEEEPQLHKDIKKMMHSVFSKLDSLTNFYFTPKQSTPDLKIISNLPAINMEEVAPVATSDAAMLAPEEVKPKNRGDVIGKSERTDTDKKRERRKKKENQKKHANANKKKLASINKMNPGLGNKYSKEKAKKLLDQVTKDRNVDKMDESLGSKSVKSSTAFFTELQDQVKAQIKNKTKQKQSNIAKNIDAKKMKL